MATRIIASGDAHPIPPQEGANVDRIALDPNKAAAKLREVEAMASDAFSQIEALVNLSLLAMETPAGASAKSIEHFAQVFLVIRGIAQETQGSIETEAGDAIALHVDGGERRRYDAWAASRRATADAAGDAQ